MKTDFAPPERASEERVRQQTLSLFEHPYIEKLYDGISEGLLILNPERQIVYANGSFLKALGVDFKAIKGLRSGEALRCIHAFKTEGGCGTTEFCRECGGAQAILSSQKGSPDLKECRILQKDSGDALDLQVKTSQLQVDGVEYTVFAVKDISSDKRRRILEKIFFHDIMNTAVGVRGLSELLSISSPETLDEFRNMIYSGAAKLVDEIRSQRDLANAENNELQVQPVKIHSLDFLKEVFSLYQNHEVGKDKILHLDTDSEDLPLESDRALLFRVLGNMTKNALEASQPGDTVTLGCRREGDRIRFFVHNPAFMPRKIQLQVFQRSFSTKGAGRGLGTYSIKLLTERYLKGEVFFTSSEKEGTCFYGVYPLSENAETTKKA
ncbi:PAS domain-containing protein [Desulfobotulus alkaliphilus]|uniref:histidine kinase n=1 Tax=Desulfobotulus alkaliphilus TaxID=622671 RepID=A0A562S2N2_9BACT|nr:ATP-binding protein [Desulfobotulus alkaliphilus]TWI75647.1 PAS domain-containing protein [Desulfobotulus alkaliphilus]